MEAARRSNGRRTAGVGGQTESPPATGLASFICPELILVGIEPASMQDVVRRLARLLEEQGYVHPSFAQAVIDREKKFPTGLPTAEVQVALPHTDIEHCVRPGMAVATLARPVRFVEMATHDRPVNAEIVFLLSIVQPSEQVKWLQRLVTLFQTAGFLGALKRAPDPQACAKLLRQSLKKVVE